MTIVNAEGANAQAASQSMQAQAPYIAGALALAAGGEVVLPLVASIPGAPIFSTGGLLGTGAWAAPMGTRVISAGINAGSHYLQNGSVNPMDVATSFGTGMAGAHGGLLWNIGVNAAGGAALNNAIYGKSDSVAGSALISGLLSSLGYGVDKLGESWVSSVLKPSIDPPNWASTGSWSGSGWNLLNANNFGPIGGSIGGASG